MAKRRQRPKSSPKAAHTKAHRGRTPAPFLTGSSASEPDSAGLPPVVRRIELPPERVRVPLTQSSFRSFQALRPASVNLPTQVYTRRSALSKMVAGALLITVLLAATLFIQGLGLHEKNTAAATATTVHRTAYDRSAIEHLIRAYLAADSLDEILPRIRHPERLREPIAQFIQQGKHVAKSLDRIVDIVQLNQPTDAFYFVAVESNALSENLLVERQPDGTYRLDWESHRGFNEADWESFRSAASGTADFRVYASLSDYYNFHFEDNNAFMAFRLDAPNSESPCLYGYVDRRSPLAQDIREHLSGKVRVPLQLRLRHPSGPPSSEPKPEPQVWIDALIAPHWVTMEDTPPTLAEISPEEGR